MRTRSCLARGLTAVLLFSMLAIEAPPAAPDDKAQTKKEKDEKRKELAKEIRQRDEDGNGIFLDSPKVYDDSSLQLMLNAARAKLATLQGLDQATLLSHLGAITGSTFQQSLFSAQVAGPPLPQSVLTATGPTSTVAATTGASPSTTTTTTAPNQSVVTTNAGATPSTPTAPTDTGFTLPSTFATSSIDTLNEEMQLTYEIANLQLLLEGSLSDRFVQGQRIVKPRTTIGFPVTLSAERRYKDAVAIVEVEVEKPEKNVFSQEPPAVTALLPREKTYNVAAVKDKMTSIGGGVVTSIISGGASWIGGRKTFYLVRDQDTVAVAQPASDGKRTAFAWQFRPVLGESFVRTGMRQAFVQLAVPTNNFASCFGKVHVRTYWRKYDRKSGIVGDVIASSIRERDPWPIPVYDLAPQVNSLKYEDLGGGQIQVEIGGRFLGGTYIRVGSAYFHEGTPGFTSEANQIRFVVSAAEIALGRAYIVSRDGAEVEILDPTDPEYRNPLPQSCDADPSTASNPDQNFQNTATATVTVTSFDDSNVLMEVHADKLPVQSPAPKSDKYGLLVGNRFFGLRDTSFERKTTSDSVSYRTVVPVSVFGSVREVTLLPLFWKRDKFALAAPINDFSLTSGGEKLVLIEKTDKLARFVLYGNRLKEATVLAPSGLKLQPVDGLQDDGTIRAIELTAEQLKTSKQIILQKASKERPTFVAVPAADAKDGSKAALALQNRITVGMDEATITGDGLDKLKAVRYKKTVLKFALSDDKKSVTVTGLAAARVTGSPVERELELEFENGQKGTVKIDVVNARVETIDRTKN